MRFQLDEEVNVKATGRKGKIKQTKHELLYKNGVRTEINQYLVDLGGHYSTWFKEDELSPMFSNEFEIGLIKLLIDVNLSRGNYEKVKLLHQEQLTREKGMS